MHIGDIFNGSNRDQNGPAKDARGGDKYGGNNLRRGLRNDFVNFWKADLGGKYQHSGDFDGGKQW